LRQPSEDLGEPDPSLACSTTTHAIASDTVPKVRGVLAWEPPLRLLVTWQINGSWQYDPDPLHASEIEVRFTAEGPERTRVELEHRHLDRLVDGQALRDGIGDGGGWSSNLEHFARAVASEE
jgi:Activator of Hsp90 ATPase homolog 1-like protein